jgi:AcrR family transcriptional regulator
LIHILTDCTISHMTRSSAVAKKEEIVREFRVREILGASYRVVARHGFQGATVERVAEEAGIAKGTVYLYFRTKEELLEAAVKQGIEEFSSQVRAAVTEVSGPLARLHRLVETSMRLGEEQRDFFKTLLLEKSFFVTKLSQSETAPMLDLYLSYIRFIEAVIQEGIDAGALRPHDVTATAFILNESMRGCFQQRVLGLTTRSATQDAEILLDLLFYGILNPNHKEHSS